MSAEIVSAIANGLAWSVAAAASTARPRLGLGRLLVGLAWSLAAISLTGATIAAATSTTRPATAFVWAGSALAILVGARASRDVARSASSEGSSVLALLAVASISAGVVLAGALLLTAIVGWPDEPAVLINATLAGLGGLATFIQLGAASQGTAALLPVAVGVGVVGGSGCMAILLVHLLFGDITTDALTPAEAIGAATFAASSSVLMLPPTLRAVRHRLAQHRPDRQRVLARLDQLVDRRAPLDETLLQAVELLRSSLGLQQAEVWRLNGSRLELAAADPYTAPKSIEIDDTTKRVAAASSQHASGNWARTWMPDLFGDSEEPIIGAVSYAGSLQGILVARPGSIAGDLVPDLILDVARRLGPVVHSASLDASLSQSLIDLQERQEELRASRERLVTAADNERWRIERDLHDGAQQELVALGVNLQLARGLVESNPQRAQGLIDELIDAARSTTEQLRSLSHGIYPQILEDEGIGPALDEAASRHGGMAIQVTSSTAGRFPREVEAAVYFSCSEAITNAVKHAGASHIIVSLVVDDDELLFEVADDGGGFNVEDTAMHGNGLHNMADRLGAIGGTLTITSAEAGTRTVGAVPLSDQADR